MRLINAHKLKIQGRGYLNFLQKSLGGQGFQEKFPVGPPILGFIAFLLASILKFGFGEVRLGNVRKIY